MLDYPSREFLAISAYAEKVPLPPIDQKLRDRLYREAHDDVGPRSADSWTKQERCALDHAIEALTIFTGTEDA